MKYLLGSHQWVKEICLKIIRIRYDRVQKKKTSSETTTQKWKYVRTINAIPKPQGMKYF